MSPTDYNKKTVKELKEIAKDKKIAGYSKMSKHELVEALKSPKDAASSLKSSKNSASSLEKELYAAVEDAHKRFVVAQDVLRVAEENLKKFRTTKENPTARMFQITVNTNSLKYDRLVGNIKEVKEVLTESFLKPRSENPNDYSFKDIESWMNKAKVSNTSVEISIDANDFIISSRGYMFGALIRRIS